MMMKHKIAALISTNFLALAVYAAPAEMMEYYNNPHSAPKVTECKNNIHCNAFVALSKQWKSIPDNYRYHGSYNIKHDAAVGDGYGLNKGFSLCSDKSESLYNAGEEFFYGGGGKGKQKERIFAQGMAVLLYIEDTQKTSCQ
ncbi:MAG: hypothetical protein J6M43_03150 [Neisseriaceae bacterium]|nr:hypothetical protein [Neisseriaceae bacterium]